MHYALQYSCIKGLRHAQLAGRVSLFAETRVRPQCCESDTSVLVRRGLAEGPRDTGYTAVCAGSQSSVAAAGAGWCCWHVAASKIRHTRHKIAHRTRPFRVPRQVRLSGALLVRAAPTATERVPLLGVVAEPRGTAARAELGCGRDQSLKPFVRVTIVSGMWMKCCSTHSGLLKLASSFAFLTSSGMNPNEPRPNCLVRVMDSLSNR